ncbi:SGNH/GDSL hydrolase family protein [Paraflavitalea pollutisoli]|uniref:SGNH/GDSL hydrolase family protein n=1 Tax=Paraflavitalea pollutisoli TaxID=3034143 RepID=UPI0023EDBCD1|nr:SGNH/GDSL hydrolase family protein [Paraflavitalea sp. H1-2-19X]
MKILVAGDSITRGTVGASYTKVLQQRFPHWQINNIGRNGDTLLVITQRLLRTLSADNTYDFIVLQGGYNDILLPWFGLQNAWFRFAYRSQLKKGIIPITNPHHYEEHLRQTIKAISRLCNGKIILTTIGCINENLSFSLNYQREQYNHCVRNIARSEPVLLADCAKDFEAHLKSSRPRPYFIQDFVSVTFLDRLISALPGGPWLLSKKRKLQLTTDGVHLNHDGALLYSNAIRSTLLHTVATCRICTIPAP